MEINVSLQSFPRSLQLLGQMSILSISIFVPFIWEKKLPGRADKSNKIWNM